MAVTAHEVQATGEQPRPLRSAAAALVEGLELHGVPFVFGIPGAKIDAVFDSLLDRSPRIIVCRHEQNAAFMAAAVGRLTGFPGVCVATSGPGASNLVTGLATATTEGDPVIAIVGSVPRLERLKRTHQSMDTTAMFAAVAKHSVQVDDPDDVPEVLANAFRTAVEGRPGAVVISLPQDVQSSLTHVPAIGWTPPPALGSAPPELVRRAADALRSAALPVLLVGTRGSVPAVVDAITLLLTDFPMPAAETFQGAGALAGAHESLFVGRVGLFRNQPADRVLAAADVVLTVGYDPVEYGPHAWNHGAPKTIVHLDELAADWDTAYQPQIELRGDPAATLNELQHRLGRRELPTELGVIVAANRPQLGRDLHVDLTDASPARPLAVVSELRKVVPEEAVVACDIGSNYIWMARHFRASGPRQLLFSNGQQTLGVAMPWAMAANLVGHRAVSVSGDGGFLFSGAELETAVRCGLSFVHIVLRDDSYNMVAFQQQEKYGRTSGIQLGYYDLVKFAEAFGATGLRVRSESDLPRVLEAAFAAQGPVLVDVPVDYLHNADFLADLLPDDFH
ncbi:MAG TPA: acetolactate synthase AlsS [Mycobacteriales bacterium]|jgi:acetolactate synthase-1/2/3 large subunit|nr:acetolactate synthase AlsS [Mycobacteriales bacterium]